MCGCRSTAVVMAVLSARHVVHMKVRSKITAFELHRQYLRSLLPTAAISTNRCTDNSGR